MSLLRSLGKLPWLDLVIGLALVAGGVVAYLTGAEQSRLQSENDRLAKLAGDLVVHDPTKVYVRTFPGEDEREFAWRVYLPPGMGDREGEQQIARWGIARFDDHTILWYRFPGIKSSAFLEPEIADVYWNHWDQIEFNKAGAERPEVFDNPADVKLLRVRIPESLLKQAGVPAELFPQWKEMTFYLGT